MAGILERDRESKIAKEKRQSERENGRVERNERECEREKGRMERNDRE